MISFEMLSYVTLWLSHQEGNHLMWHLDLRSPEVWAKINMRVLLTGHFPWPETHYVYQALLTPTEIHWLCLTSSGIKSMLPPCLARVSIPHVILKGSLYTPFLGLRNCPSYFTKIRMQVSFTYYIHLVYIFSLLISWQKQISLC